MTPIGTRCAYQKLDSGIREFVFLEKSPAAVDEWLKHLDRIMVNDPPQTGVKELVLLDIRQHIPSVIYATQRLYLWHKDYEVDDPNTFVALLIDKQSQMVISVASTVSKIVGIEAMKVRYFIRERQKAIDWLIGQQSA